MLQYASLRFLRLFEAGLLAYRWGLDELSQMYKVFERVIMKKIERKMEGGMNDAQRGFRRDSSTENSWITAKGYIRLS